jgi:hypothetical protein
MTSDSTGIRDVLGVKVSVAQVAIAAPRAVYSCGDTYYYNC